MTPATAGLAACARRAHAAQSISEAPRTTTFAGPCSVGGFRRNRNASGDPSKACLTEPRKWPVMRRYEVQFRPLEVILTAAAIVLWTTPQAQFEAAFSPFARWHF